MYRNISTSSNVYLCATANTVTIYIVPKNAGNLESAQINAIREEWEPRKNQINKTPLSVCPSRICGCKCSLSIRCFPHDRCRWLSSSVVPTGDSI